MFSVLRGACPVRNNIRTKGILAFRRGFVFRSVRSAPRLPTEASKLKLRFDIPAKIRITQCREFQTTQRRDIPPLFALFLKPVLRIGSLVFGRILKKWWRKRTPAERERVAAWFQKKKPIFYGIFGAFLGTLLIVYLTHIERAPVTNRLRFNLFSKSQQTVFDKYAYEELLKLHKDYIVPTSHPIYNKIAAITQRILISNQDLEAIKEKNWTLNIVDLPLQNAFVLPGGNIFVFTGILKMVENVDQLSVILAHEIAHVVLGHSIEQLSSGFIIDLLLVVPMLIVWAVFPDLIAGLIQYLGISFFNIIHDLPYSRKLETEADEVGLAMAAKACVDVREAVVFWGLMRSLKEFDGEPEEIPWLSTHPNHKDREKHLNEEMSKAITLRSDHKCPILSPIDPRKKFYAQSIKEIETKFKQRGVIP